VTGNPESGLKATCKFLEVVCVDDFVAVALLGKEALTVLSEVLVNGVASNQGVEVGSATVGLWAQKSAEALSFFLA
jgi:hypothetical protein